MEAGIRKVLLSVAVVVLLAPPAVVQTQEQSTLDSYVIDTEGGQTALVVPPTEGERVRPGVSAKGHRCLESSGFGSEPLSSLARNESRDGRVWRNRECETGS